LLRTPGLYRARRLRDGSLALILANQNGTVFVAADGRLLWRVDDNSGLPTSVLFDVAPDREGGLWLCLATGLARIEWPSAFSLFDRAQRVARHAWSMARHDGVFYFGTDEGLYRLVPGRAETGNARFELVMKGRTVALLPDPRGLIAVTNTSGIVQLDATGPRKILEPAKSVFALLRSQRDPDRVWLGSADDVRSMRRVGETWRDEGPIAGVPTGTRTLAETADGAAVDRELDGWRRIASAGARRARPSRAGTRK